MNLLFALISIFAASTYSAKLVKRLVNGVDINIQEVPYQANIIYYGSDEEKFGEPVCGASIISDVWLITAAHCLEDLSKEELKIRTGASNRYKDGTEYTIESMKIHENFTLNEYVYSNDIGLIKLTKPIEFNDKQRPIPLPESTDVAQEGQLLKITGFGREDIDNKTGSISLRVADLVVVPLSRCQDDYFMDPVTDKMLCAGVGVGAPSPCKGDSGGPGVIDGKLYAIISTGFFCKPDFAPSVYTAVYKHLDWIQENTDGIKGLTS